MAALTLALSSVAGAATAQDDRYGAPHPDAEGQGQATPVAYRGPFLSWAGKTQLAQPEPPMTQAPAAVSAAYAPPPPRQPPASPQIAPPPAAPPGAQAMSTPPAGPPAPSQAASAAPSAQADASTQLGVRFYSLHRDFGLTPDPDPTPTDHPMVLVGPPTGPQTGGAGASDDGDGGKAGQQGAASDSGTE
jgi:hypothetical protein